MKEKKIFQTLSTTDPELNFDTINSMLENMLKKIRTEHDRELTKTIKEKLDIDIDLKEEFARRFPRIAKVVIYNGKESYYWNDGSKDGLHLLSYVPVNNDPISFNEEDFSYRHEYRFKIEK